MNERERLIELLQDWGNKENDGVRAESIADYLLESGVIVSPVKIGDTLYVRPASWTYGAVFAPQTSLIIAEVVSVVKTKRQTFIKLKALNKTFTHYKYKRYLISAIGITVFLTKEEAERALKGGAAKEK